jgi:Ras-related protein Rab-27A
MESFQNIRSWVDLLHEHFIVYKKQDPLEEAFILVGNKCELENERQVRKEQAMELAQEYGFAYIEVSAATGKNVTQAFQVLAHSKTIQFLCL